MMLSRARRLAEQPTPVLLLLNLRTGADPVPDAQSTWVMALKRTRMPLSALVLSAFTKEETQHFVQALAWAEQLLEVENTSSTAGCPGNRQTSPSRDALAPFPN